MQEWEVRLRHFSNKQMTRVANARTETIELAAHVDSTNYTLCFVHPLELKQLNLQHIWMWTWRQGILWVTTKPQRHHNNSEMRQHHELIELERFERSSNIMQEREKAEKSSKRAHDGGVQEPWAALAAGGGGLLGALATCACWTFYILLSYLKPLIFA